MPSEKNPAYLFHDECEKKVYIKWVNENLFNQNNMGSHLPLNPYSEEIFDQINDGLIFCLTVKIVFPNSLDEVVINRNEEISKDEKLKNLQLAYETARSFGCKIIDLKLDHIFSGVRQSVLEFFWQIFYVGFVKSIIYLDHPEIILLKGSDDTMDAIKRLQPEETLVKYVNYFIQKYNPSGKKMNSFKDNLNDGVIYAYLLDSISKHYGLSLKNEVNSIVRESDEYNRFTLLLENFDSLKLQVFLVDELMKMDCLDQACYKMHLLTVAVIFKKYSVISPENVTQMNYCIEQVKPDRESNLEKLSKIFLNFLGVNPVCTNLRLDCKDGLLMAHIMEMFSKGVFQRDTFISEFSENQAPSERIHNGAICLNRFSKFLSCPIEDLFPEHIQSGHRTVISHILFNLMLFWVYSLEVDKKFNKKELLLWINSFTDEYQIHSFRDTVINDKRVLTKTLEFLCPNSIDWCYMDKLTTNFDRALYTVSVARREGYPMFVNPKMIAVGDHRCLTLAFAILQTRTVKATKKCPEGY